MGFCGSFLTRQQSRVFLKNAPYQRLHSLTIKGCRSRHFDLRPGCFKLGVVLEVFGYCLNDDMALPVSQFFQKGSYPCLLRAVGPELQGEPVFSVLQHRAASTACAERSLCQHFIAQGVGIGRIDEFCLGNRR